MATFTQADVIEYITFNACTALDPVLSVEDVTYLVETNTLADGTWNIPWLVAEAWTLKAGRAAERYQFASEGGINLQREQVMAQCNQMAAQWRKRQRNSFSTLTAEVVAIMEA